MGSKPNWLRYTSILALVLFLAEVVPFIPTAQVVTQSSNNITIAANVNELGPGQVVVVAINDPSEPNDIGFIVQNLRVYVGTTLIPVTNQTVYVLEKGTIYYLFLTATPNVSYSTMSANKVGLANSMFVYSGYNSNMKAQVNMTLNLNLTYSSTYMTYQYHLPSSLKGLIYNNASKTVSTVNTLNLWPDTNSTSASEITVSFTQPGVTTVQVQLQNLEDQDNSYCPTLVLAPTAQSFLSQVGFLPFNSSIPVMYEDDYLQAVPFSNNTFVYVNNEKPVYVAQNVTYPSIAIGQNVNTTIFADNVYPSSITQFGVAVYDGNYTMYTTTVVTNSTYGTLTSGQVTPAYVNGASYYRDTVKDHVPGLNTPVQMTFTDFVGFSNDISSTISFSPITVKSFSFSVSSPGTLTVYAPDNVTNMSETISLPATAVLQYVSNGSTINATTIILSEEAPGSPYFTLTFTISYGKYGSVSSSGAVTVTPSEYSKTRLVINATNDIGASYYVLGYKHNVNSSGIGSITVYTPTLSIFSPTTQYVTNTTRTLTFVFNEPNLKFGVPTTLKVSNEDLVYNGTTVATAKISILYPNGTTKSYNLTHFGITTLTSPRGNGTFFITIVRSELPTSLPAGTQLTLQIDDKIVIQTLTASYIFQVIVPTVLLQGPTTGYSSSIVVYLPNLEGSGYTHTVNVLVEDNAYAQTNPKAVLIARVTIYLDNSSLRLIPDQSYPITVTETAADSGNFTGSFTYYVNSTGYLYINNMSTGLKASKIIGGAFNVSYTSSATSQTATGMASVTTAGITLATNVSTSESGKAINVSVVAPGLVKSHTSSIEFPLEVQALLWNGYSSTLVPVHETMYVKEISKGNETFMGILYLGNQSIANSTSLAINNLAGNGYTVAPSTTVYVNFTNEISRFSTTTSLVPSYHQVAVSVVDTVSGFNLGIYNVKIITPSPAAFDSNIVINISSPLFSLFKHPIPGNFSLTSMYESVVGAPLSTIEAKVSGQVLTESDIMSIASSHTAYFNTSPVPYYLIYVKMTSWNGVPNSFMSGALNVNFTDQVYLSGNMYSFTQITVPNRFGIEQVVAGYTTLTIASNIQSLQIGVVSPIVSIYYNGVNITANPSLALSFPNTSTGILANITVYSPSSATKYSSINVTVTNPATGVKTYVTLPEKGLTGYYEGNLRIVSTSYYSLYAGQPGVISVAPGKVNNISVISTINIGKAYIKGVKTLVDVSGSNYFFVGKIILKPEVTALTVINVSTGKPVSLSNLMTGKTYELLFNMTNVGTVTSTVYAVVEVTVNTSVVLPPEVFVESIAPGTTVTFGPEWTPTMAGSYNVTILLFSNPSLTVPYVPGKYVYAATVSS
ncbi:hypothetical protein CM19_07825 [Candidatus Acidianus copahuensis]|uniref:S-layer protein n=1 Tax=Candidatus Acidianus copahuensis TaxID=1160895 RepID=A0A031LN62_9CREN|nr:S-layer protein SlaA [Candidatus Acidianus copahuensis]EZQ04941.1 hypothetical protein CM19_07825 [Candidatus Acidianus copahuensis]